MDEPDTVRLSALEGVIAVPANRREFLARASALSLAIPGIGAALIACSPSSGRDDTARQARAAAAPGTASQGGPPRIHNSDSRLDSAVLRGEHHVATTGPVANAVSTTVHRGAP